VQIGKDPDTGIRNLSVHRMLVLGKDNSRCGRRRIIISADDLEG
jgi:UbiD family decarboxylase